jgi:hypothetical protein
MVKKNGLISENKTAIKNATDILPSSAAKVFEPASTDYIKAVSLVTPEPKTSKNTGLTQLSHMIVPTTQRLKGAFIRTGELLTCP